ncbi:MAG: thiamine-phosphate kinase [Akkermansia sp.]|nr:thiamine-phosphate kinase [Akkermansia sp.]
MHQRLRELGENAVLERLLSHLSPGCAMLVGPGDDCAVVPRNEQWDTLLKTDVVVESIHFTPDTPPELIGRKALARAVSDIAAMGGIPEHALVTLLIHPDRPVARVEGVYAGLSALAARFNISVAGGETSSLPADGMVINVALTGRVEHGKAILRTGASPGDILCVSGKLGGSFPSGRHLNFTPRVELARKLLCEGPVPTAMMDLSDGIATDLPRLAAASGCSFELWENSIPCHDGCSIQQALSDGEDYELLLTLTPEAAEALAPDRSLSLTPIGRMLPLHNGVPHLSGGWQHFCA